MDAQGMGAMTFSIGLTGGIGCGKTTVADMFAALGATLVDTDLIAHSLTAPQGLAMPAIVAEFGPQFAAADGSLARAHMRELVFNEAGAKARLEAILHPRIVEGALAQAAAASGAYVIFVVPLLVQSPAWRQRVSRIVVIDCPEAMQVARVMARNGLTEPQVRAIMAAQATRAERLAAADDVITNEGEIDALHPQIAFLHAKYLAISQRMSRLPMQRL